MMLVNPRDLILGCSFADCEHLIIANALNAIGKLLIYENDKDTVFKEILPVSLDYLSKHLLHEERVLENAFEFWVEEQNLGDLYEELKRNFWYSLKEKGKDFKSYDFKDFMEFKSFIEKQTNNAEIAEIMKWWQLIENQKHGHKSVAETLKRELEKIDANSSPKKIASELGMIVSYILSRVLKLDKKYVLFYKEHNIPACGEKPLIPPMEVIEILENILEKDFVNPFEMEKIAA